MNDREYSSEDLNDPRINIRLGTWYLASLKKSFPLTDSFLLCLFLGILVKRSAFAIGFLLVLSIAEGIAKVF